MSVCESSLHTYRREICAVLLVERAHLASCTRKRGYSHASDEAFGLMVSPVIPRDEASGGLGVGTASNRDMDHGFEYHGPRPNGSI